MTQFDWLEWAVVLLGNWSLYFRRLINASSG